MLEHLPNSQQPFYGKELESAFSSFNQASSALEAVYRELETKVSSLNSELSEARNEKVQQYEEKEKIANRLQHLLNILPAGVVVLDNNGAITECNPAAENLLGTPLLSRQWRDVVENSFSPRWDDGHDMTLVDGRSVNISTQSLDGESGQLVLLKEVTETRQLQEQLGQLKRLSAMGEMAASLAHQIRTPLSTAVLYASNLKNTYCDRARQLRFTEKLLSRLQHLETLIEDMLLFARGGSFDFKCYRIRDLLEDFVNGIEQVQGRVTVSLDVSKLDQSVEVNVNQHAISSVLQNLVDNSINASTGPLQLTMEAGISDEGWLEILVSDDGPGIPGDVQDKIFDPFFTTRSSGTGLGLAVADSVIKSHGGTIRLLKENKLTTFRIKLPVASD